VPPHRFPLGHRAIDTTWLEDFLAVAEEGSFSRAAGRRAITQSAFSRRVRALEEWVGTTLLDRSTHVVRLTPAGEHFRPAVYEMLHRLSTAREDALAAASRALRTLHFASTHALAMTFFPDWLRTLEEPASLDATIQLTADNMVACERLMAEGQVHFLICHYHPAALWRLGDAGFRSVVLGTDVLLPVAEPSIARKGLGAGQNVLAYAPESGMGRILAAVWATEDIQRKERLVFSSHLASALVTMAREGRGVAWAPRSLVAADLASGRLACVRGPDAQVTIEIRIFRPKARQPEAAESFWQRVLSHGVATGEG
jgi:DNA-binding transcriptional LysR family regulator